MQTILDSSSLKLRSHLQSVVDSHERALLSMPAPSTTSPQLLSSEIMQVESPMALNAKIIPGRQPQVIPAAKKIIDFDAHQRNNHSPTQTVELANTPQKQQIQPTVTKDSSQGSGLALHLTAGGICSCGEHHKELVTYRGMDFKTKELIEMRNVIHQKIE